MVKEFTLVTGQVYLVFLVLNNLILFLWFKKFPSELKMLAFYLFASLLTDLFSRWLFYKHLNNLFLLHAYTLVEFVAWSVFYRKLYSPQQLIHKIIPWAIVIVSILIIANSFFLEPLSGFNSNAKSLVQLILIGYAVHYFFYTFGKTDLTQPLPRAIVFINFSVIFYYSGSLFIFMFSKLLADYQVADGQQHGLWAINAILLVIFHVLIFYSLWTVAFPKTKS